MRKILNYTIPPIKCYMHHAIPLGVFWDENDQNIMNWFCMNYNYILAGTKREDNFFTFLVDYNSVPFLQRREIYGDELEKYLIDHSFSDFVKMMIDNGNFVEVMVDLFYMPGGLKHAMHEILILGYDDEKNIFIIRDYIQRKFQEIEVPQSQVVPYENCEYYGDNIVMKLYRKRINVFPFDKKGFLLQLSDYYNNVNPFGRAGFAIGEYFQTWERMFGMKVYDKMRASIEESASIDYRALRVVHEHFEGMRVKLDYIKNQGYLNLDCLDKMIANYTNASSKAGTMVLAALKHELSTGEKRSNLKQRVLLLLKELIDEEKIYLKEFLQEAYSHENESSQES